MEKKEVSAELERLCGLEEEQKALLSKENQDPEHDRAMAQGREATLKLQEEAESIRRAVEVCADAWQFGCGGRSSGWFGWDVAFNNNKTNGNLLPNGPRHFRMRALSRRELGLNQSLLAVTYST